MTRRDECYLAAGIGVAALTVLNVALLAVSATSPYWIPLQVLIAVSTLTVTVRAIRL